MSTHGKTDEEIVATTHNVSRFCVEHPQVTFVLLVLTMLWGVGGYLGMPQRKDPDVPVRQAAILVPWPGNGALKVEDQVTRVVEDAISQNAWVETVESTSRTSLSTIFLTLDENLADTGTQLDDLGLKLNALADQLPPGAGPITYLKDFGDTAALMLTVASPPFSEFEVELRARPIAEDIERIRRQHPAPPGEKGRRVTLVACWPPTDSHSLQRKGLDGAVEALRRQGLIRHPTPWMGLGYMAMDGFTTATDAELIAAVNRFVEDFLQRGEIHPDAWEPVCIAEPKDTLAALLTVAGDKYTYRELDDYTKKIEEALRAVPEATKVDRTGVLEENIYLLYSQERLASYGIQGPELSDILKARNIPGAGGMQESDGRSVRLQASGEFQDEHEIGDVAVAQSAGAPVYLRDMVDIVRSYEAPPRFLNFYTWQDDKGRWHRNRAITVSVQMRSGRQIQAFGEAVDAKLAELAAELPPDLVIRRTSDQPQQVEESISLFNKSLYEAIGLVVVVSLIGFWEWRSALLMALAIPITLAMTYGMMWTAGIDLQQVSVASLILALGLLVDDPVVAGDAIKHSLAAGQPRTVASWLGPTKLAVAILYATVTNIAAYLPFLLMSGDTGRFLYSLPVVITCSLVASRLVSMSFVPFLGRYLLRAGHEPPMETRRTTGATGFYYRFVAFCVGHRWKVLLASFLFLAAGLGVLTTLPSQFFPKDLQYLCYVDLYLPTDQTLSATDEQAQKVEGLIRQVAHEIGGGDVLEAIDTFEGGGGPRFWFSVDPQLNQLNYAQLVIRLKDKEYTQELAQRLSLKLQEEMAGVRTDVRQLDTGVPVKLPVAVRLVGDDLATLERLGAEVKKILRAVPDARQVRDDWGEEMLTLNVETDPDRATLVGITNYDVARSTALALNGEQVGTLREGDRQIPIYVRMQMNQRAQLSDLKNLYIQSTRTNSVVPLEQVARISMEMQPQTVRRRQFHRTLTVGCYPAQGVLPSEVFTQAWPALKKFQDALPVGYSMEVAGEQAEQTKGFAQLVVVMIVSMAGIYLALVMQFKNAIKPLIVFCAIPYGMAGAVLCLGLMGAPFGFMAFLGVASLVGVIVSHIIVLFDYIEEMHAEGEDLEQSVMDAGIARLRPVFITVGATVIALFPLAAHGGPLWEPLCYAQIGGLTAATMITLVLVPVLYVIAVRDLKILKWEAGS